jgi:hypothetical protein
MGQLAPFGPTEHLSRFSGWGVGPLVAVTGRRNVTIEGPGAIDGGGDQHGVWNFTREHPTHDKGGAVRRGR